MLNSRLIPCPKPEDSSEQDIIDIMRPLSEMAAAYCIEAGIDDYIFDVLGVLQEWRAERLYIMGLYDDSDTLVGMILVNRSAKMFTNSECLIASMLYIQRTHRSNISATINNAIVQGKALVKQLGLDSLIVHMAVDHAEIMKKQGGMPVYTGVEFF